MYSEKYLSKDVKRGMLRLFHIDTATAVRLSYEHYFEKKIARFRRAAAARPLYEIIKSFVVALVRTRTIYGAVRQSQGNLTTVVRIFMFTLWTVLSIKSAK